MNELLKTTLLGLFFGTFGTTIGGIIGVKIKHTSNKFLSFILSIASGLMMAIVTFDLIPDAIEISSMKIALIGLLSGVVCMLLCDIFVNKVLNKKENKLKNQAKIYEINKYKNRKNYNSSLLKTGIIVSIGLAIHNFPEGLAIGSGFEASIKLGLALAIAICIHDVPEGISMAIPLKNGGVNPIKVIFYVILSGVTTGLGAFVGKLIGSISTSIIAVCLGFAGGAMLYIVSGELIPEANKLYSGKISTLGNILGFILGMIATKL